MIKNVGGLALGAALTALVQEATLPIWTVRGLQALASVGGSAGAAKTADVWGSAKRRIIEDPYWRDKVLKLSSPTYFLQSLQRGR
ncbi:hypothetical protein DJ018_17725 [Phenylobacterium deserti]|uniref:Uncharacterized protein n=1 Tax=Phenylobacterium deserti TaxID=1914756 RepID=A0A328A912_9CAUL|nr:hypothetical protein DJ018_17725 [Phenylobacterium deserti]